MYYSIKFKIVLVTQFMSSLGLGALIIIIPT